MPGAGWLPRPSERRRVSHRGSTHGAIPRARGRAARCAGALAHRISRDDLLASVREKITAATELENGGATHSA